MTTTDLCAVLFPGQGSQEKGMGRDIAEADAQSMELWKTAESVCGYDLRGLYWDGDDADMAETRWLQPALTVVGMTFWRQAKGKISPAFAAGHSLGEFSALFAAGALDAKSIIELVALRGRLMSECGGTDGAMAAMLKMNRETVDEIVREAADSTGKPLRIANYNTPVQYVVSGHVDAVAAAEAQAKPNKGRGIRLAVSGAFHSPMMNEAAAELAKVMDKLHWRNADFPVVLNVTGAPQSAGPALCEQMKKQMISSVLWTQSMESMWQAGVRTFVELGPKGVLTRMVGPNVKPLGDEEFEARSCPGLEAVQAL
ncbi:MAG: ACP S-malonyltransferase [Desulfovibrio sp.]|uniref:ACP S-malonyltransferase n=1 Tax=Desulfovibrio sp. 7SRBS1 TaxID=3378064 RepID=UPI003B4169EB